MARSEYVTVSFQNTDNITSSPVWQYDHGLSLKITGAAAADIEQAHFSVPDITEAIGIQLTDNGDGSTEARIPDNLLTIGKDIMAYLYYENDTYGVTVRTVRIPVRPREKPGVVTLYAPTSSAVGELVDDLNDALDRTEEVTQEAQEAADALEGLTVSATAASGSTPSATISTVDDHYHLALKLVKGDTGNGIASITKTGTSGLNDTYTIAYTDGTSDTLIVANGAEIASISKTSTSGLTDTYTVTMTDNSTHTFAVTNGRGVSTIAKTGTNANIDTYTITYNDNTTSTFTVTNGINIDSIAVTYQEGSSGTTPPTGTWSITIPSVTQGNFLWTKTVTTLDDTNATETVAYSVARMGVDGSGAVSTVNSIPVTTGTQDVHITGADILLNASSGSTETIEYAIANAGQVKTVNGETPDPVTGNVEVASAYEFSYSFTSESGGTWFSGDSTWTSQANTGYTATVSDAKITTSTNLIIHEVTPDALTSDLYWQITANGSVTFSTDTLPNGPFTVNGLLIETRSRT